MGEVSFEKITRVFIKMRDKRSKLKQEFEAADKEIKDQQEQLEQFLLKTMRDMGVESVRTPVGTIYQTETMVPQGSDWTAFYAWVKENNAFDFIFRRIKADAVKDYMEQNGGEVPPGVSVYSQLGVRIRRK
jgi:hypothetical protein